jgi:hypothetical protein
MTNKEAIHALKTRTCYECSYGCESPVLCSCFDCDLKKATILATEALERAEWIPVTERLPETSDNVLVTYILHSDRLLAGAKIVRTVVTANCCNEDWFPHDCEFNFELVDVLAWMPLPKPYAHD